MEIKNHKFTDVEFIPSPNVSPGTIKPVLIVEHYTAGWTAESAISTFQNRKSQVSAHLVVDRDGTVTQMVPFNRRAWHAGPSRYEGWKDLNSHAIGIENANVGYFRKLQEDNWLHWNGKNTYTSQQLVERGYNPAYFLEQAEPRIGSGTFFWPAYTSAQIEANYMIVAALVEHYDIQDIVSHEEIDTRGWKTDPGPTFPMRHMKMIIDTYHGGRKEGDMFQVYKSRVTTGSLNVRNGPGTEWEVFATLARNDVVPVVDRQGDWLLIELDDEGEQGWIHGYYTERA